eukprot:3436111-Prorocentrum_lima.AAC.1
MMNMYENEYMRMELQKRHMELRKRHTWDCGSESDYEPGSESDVYLDELVEQDEDGEEPPAPLAG